MAIEAVVAALVVGAIAAAPTPVWVLGELLPPVPLAEAGVISKEPLAAALARDATHGTAFRVRESLGPADAARIVVVIPQFHRSADPPLSWTSAGEAIAEVQDEIARLVALLARAHGVRCLGTEGDVGEVPVPSRELSDGAQRVIELRAAEREAVRVLGSDAPKLDASMAAVRVLLEDAVDRELRILDGAGRGVLALPPAERPARFGLEDRKLLQAALRVQRDLLAVERKLAATAPSDDTAVVDATDRLVLDEHPRFAERVALLQDAFSRADALRTSLRHEGDTLAAERVGRWLQRARALEAMVIRAADVDAFVRGARARVEAQQDAAKTTPAANDAPVAPASLLKRHAALVAEHARVTGSDREASAARAVLAKIPQRGTCIAVMGQAHRAGLVRALQAAGGPTLGVVVVEPFVFDEGVAPAQPQHP